MTFAEPTLHAKNTTNPFVTYGDDSGLLVEFSKEAVKQEFKSNQEGRPIFEDVDYIRIHFPGDRTKQIFRPVNLIGDERQPNDKDRFPRQWAAFQSESAQTPDGTPVTEWSPLTKGEALSLKAAGIHTVELLSTLPDSALMWLGARDMRNKAVAWLAQAKDGKHVIKLSEENAVLRSDIEILKKQVADLAALAEKKNK